MKVELLLGADAFWTRLREDLDRARDRAWIQTFTFEGDRAGTRLARAIERCLALDRRFLIDSYSLLYHSDRIVPGIAWLDRAMRVEVSRTHRWVRRLSSGGVQVRFGNPIGPMLTGILRRNHKKLALFDDRIAYLGGINFSDHNFAWNDMMLRIESEQLVHTLALDFLGTWAGRSTTWDVDINGLRVISVSGRGNRRAFKPLINAIGAARSTIDVVSAYLSYPFTDYLADAVSRGVRVRVLTPADNNKPNLSRHIIERGHRHKFEVFQYKGGMNHMKAMLIDSEHLVVGSSNFDFMGITLLEEHLVMTRKRDLVADFRERVWEPEISRAIATSPGSLVATRLGDAAVMAGALLASLFERD